MKRKMFIYIIGITLFVPVVVAACFNSTTAWCALIVYCLILWFSPKYSTKFKRFWRAFWKIQKSIELALEEYEK
jgi:Flp pilus assembly protein TadB